MNKELKAYPIEHVGDEIIIETSEIQEKAKTIWGNVKKAYITEVSSHVRMYRTDMAKQGKARFSRQVPTRQMRKRIKRKYK